MATPTQANPQQLLFSGVTKSVTSFTQRHPKTIWLICTPLHIHHSPLHCTKSVPQWFTEQHPQLRWDTPVCGILIRMIPMGTLLRRWKILSRLQTKVLCYVLLRVNLPTIPSSPPQENWGCHIWGNFNPDMVNFLAYPPFQEPYELPSGSVALNGSSAQESLVEDHWQRQAAWHWYLAVRARWRRNRWYHMQRCTKCELNPGGKSVSWFRLYNDPGTSCRFRQAQLHRGSCHPSLAELYPARYHNHLYMELNLDLVSLVEEDFLVFVIVPAILDIHLNLLVCKFIEILGDAWDTWHPSEQYAMYLACLDGWLTSMQRSNCLHFGERIQRIHRVSSYATVLILPHGTVWWPLIVFDSAHVHTF